MLGGTDVLPFLEAAREAISFARKKAVLCSFATLSSADFV